MNEYNYVRERSLQPLSIETLAILVACLFVLYLVRTRQASIECLLFLAIPFSDVPFRVFSVQPVEFMSVAFIAANYRRLRLTYILLLAGFFIVFSLLGYFTGNAHSFYSMGYSLRFLLTALVFTILARKEFCVPPLVFRFVVVFSFAVTFLQVVFWLVGLPIHGIFFDNLIPRAKGLAQEPAPWAVWIVTLFPYIVYFKLGRRYLLLNAATLLMTLSTLGIIAVLAYSLIRWGMGGFRVRWTRKRLRILAVTGAVLLTGCVVVPSVVQNSERLLSVFDKLVLYQYELSRFVGLNGVAAPSGLSVTESGRGLDLKLFQEKFPDNWLVGIGSFNAASEDVNQNETVTNTYLAFLMETGVLGVPVLAVLLGMHYRALFRHRDQKSRDFLAMCVTFLLMIAGIRCFAFHELWYAQASTLRLGQDGVV